MSGLLKIRRYLDLHPQEVVSIIFEAYVSEADTAAAFAERGLLPMLHAQPLADPWPTLRQLIDAGTAPRRLHRRAAASCPGTTTSGTTPRRRHYSFETPADLSCAPNRGDPGQPLFILNHFLTQVLGSPQLADRSTTIPCSSTARSPARPSASGCRTSSPSTSTTSAMSSR